MGNKTVDEASTESGTGTAGAAAAEATVGTAAAAGTGTPADDDRVTAGSDTASAAEPVDEAADHTDHTDHTDDDADDADDDLTDDPAGEELPAAEPPAGVGQGAAAVVSAVLGLVSLTGGWIGTVAGARETLVGQLRTSSSASVAKQIKEIYGDAWQTTALWAGMFALTALVTGVVVLARPAFGAPGRTQAPWIKSVAWAGVVLGVVGLLLAVLKYTGALLPLPSASS
jgi:hypothetical protein